MNVLHPALSQLVRLQTVARANKLLKYVSTPRNLIITIVAAALVAVWLSNAVVAVLFREPAEPGTLERLIPLGLLVYGLWHLIRVAYQRPEQGIVWTTSESEFIVGGPFTRGQQIVYRLTTVVTSTALKAVCFTLFLLPDLSIPWAAILGALLALSLIEFWRIGVDVAACGMNNRCYTLFRWSVLAIVAALVSVSFLQALSSPEVIAKHRESPASLVLAAECIKSLDQLRQTPIGNTIEAPLELYASVITAKTADSTLALRLAMAIGMLVALGWLVIRLDRYVHAVAKQREDASIPQLKRARSVLDTALATPLGLARIPHLKGIGTIAWRQMMEARRYRTSIIIALIPPTIFSALPLVVFDQPRMVMLNVVGALAFYTFVLLPAALKFDFQRDIDRITVLKSLPLSPLHIALGQLATPVLIASMFQCGVLCTASLARGIPWTAVAMAIGILVPMNIFVFALENVIYLLSPYRLYEDGLRIFLRTTIVFTGKGVLFALALGVVLAWAFLSRWIAATAGLTGATLFGAGLLVLIAVAAAATVSILSLVFQRFDPTSDIPA